MPLFPTLTKLRSRVMQTTLSQATLNTHYYNQLETHITCRHATKPELSQHHAPALHNQGRNLKIMDNFWVTAFVAVSLGWARDS